MGYPDWRINHRNPRPARGSDILTLTQLRYYVRRFWSIRDYGICHIHGGKEAFLRFCGEPLATHIRTKIIPEEPESEWFSAQMQRNLSRKIGQILRGEIIFVPHGNVATYKLLRVPEPPIPGEIPFREHCFAIEMTPVGPKLRRL